MRVVLRSANYPDHFVNAKPLDPSAKALAPGESISDSTGKLCNSRGHCDSDARLARPSDAVFDLSDGFENPGPEGAVALVPAFEAGSCRYAFGPSAAGHDGRRKMVFLPIPEAWTSTPT